MGSQVFRGFGLSQGSGFRGVGGSVVGDMGDLWVFGYGSLMWRPGFEHDGAEHARLAGYHRALCVRSFVHRGTPERPGLVLGLDRGGSCLGMAFRVSADRRAAVTDYLRARELVTDVYLERLLPVRLAGGRTVHALTYVVDRTHAQYAGRLDIDSAADTVMGAKGVSGENPDYVMNTVAHLRAMRIHDMMLEGIVNRIERAASHPVP
jgi:glutathione-specific gamma-glutamylcyclotransferase